MEKTYIIPIILFCLIAFGSIAVMMFAINIAAIAPSSAVTYHIHVGQSCTITSTSVSSSTTANTVYLFTTTSTTTMANTETWVYGLEGGQSCP